MIRAGASGLECKSPIKQVFGSVSSGLVALHFKAFNALHFFTFLESILGMSCLLSLELANPGRDSLSVCSKAPDVRASGNRKQKDIVNTINISNGKVNMFQDQNEG